MVISAPKEFLDMCHLLIPELKRRFAKSSPVTLIDNYRGDELIYGYFDQYQGIVLYLNRIYNPNRGYDTNKINFVLVFLHEATHAMRGFKTTRSEEETNKIQKMNMCSDFEMLYELDCRVETYQIVTSHIKELCEHPISLNEKKLNKILMIEKCKILIKCEEILSLRRTKAYLGNLLSKELYVPWIRISNIVYDLNRLPEILYNSVLVSAGIFGNFNQYSGTASPDSININSLPVTNINDRRDKNENQ